MKLIKPLIQSVKDYPNLHKLLLGENINPQKLTSDEQYILKHLNELDTQLLDILLRSIKNEDTEVKSEPILSSIAEQDEPSEEEDITDMGDVELEAYKRAGYSTYDTVTNPSYKNDKTKLKTLLDDSYPIEYEGRSKDVPMRQLLIFHLADNDIKINKSANPWKIIKQIDENFFNEVELRRQAQEGKFGTGLCKCGTGIQFLPSDPKKLVKRLNILVAEKEAGNNNVMEEVTAIADELRRKGLMNIFQLKKLSKWVSK
jgi:predicted Zn-ribbon and HTH transcriptional regulator